MKILAIHSALNDDPKIQSQVDHWRIYRPMRELSKHVDWQIDYATGVIPKYPENAHLDEFTEAEIHEGMEKVKDYDIVFSSYYPDPTFYTLMKLANLKYGVRYVMDVDDNMFSIHPGNPFWKKNGHQQVYWMQRMIADNGWIVTPSEQLSTQFQMRRKDKPGGTVVTIPNYISDDYQNPGFDNGKSLVIGYMGGASHFFDLDETGVIEAVERIMHEHKEIHFQTIGMFVDKYTPKARTHLDLGRRGSEFMSVLFPTLNFDIALAPLVDDLFNAGKSDIKWQEYTRAHSPVIASNVGPYRDLKDGVNALLVRENTADAWYKAIKTLVDSPRLRQILVDHAARDVANLRIEDHWEEYQQLFNRVLKQGETNANHRTGPGLFAGKAA